MVVKVEKKDEDKSDAVDASPRLFDVYNSYHEVLVVNGTAISSPTGQHVHLLQVRKRKR